MANFELGVVKEFKFGTYIKEYRAQIVIKKFFKNILKIVLIN